jgi:hypothetical protein
MSGRSFVPFAAVLFGGLFVFAGCGSKGATGHGSGDKGVGTMEYATLVEQSLEELRIKTEAHDRVWQLSEAAWSVDQATGEIVFTNKDGMTATCAVQILGTFNTADSTWLWAWDHPSVESELAEHARTLKAYGEAHKISDLTTRKLTTTEDKCWEFAAVACKLNDAQGAYRGPAGETAKVFMTFGTPRLEGGDKARSPMPEKSDARFGPEIPSDVRQTLKGFIAALHDWETAAWRDYDANRNDKEKAWERIGETRRELLQKSCCRDLRSQGAAFSSDPSHDPDREVLISAALSGGECRVRTQMPRHTGSVRDFEYHLKKEDGSWKIKQLYFVDMGELFECL